MLRWYQQCLCPQTAMCSLNYLHKPAYSLFNISELGHKSGWVSLGISMDSVLMLQDFTVCALSAEHNSINTNQLATSPPEGYKERFMCCSCIHLFKFTKSKLGDVLDSGREICYISWPYFAYGVWFISNCTVICVSSRDLLNICIFLK